MNSFFLFPHYLLVTSVLKQYCLFYNCSSINFSIQNFANINPKTVNLRSLKKNNFSNFNINHFHHLTALDKRAGELGDNTGRQILKDQIYIF